MILLGISPGSDTSQFSNCQMVSLHLEAILQQFFISHKTPVTSNTVLTVWRRISVTSSVAIEVAIEDNNTIGFNFFSFKIYSIQQLK